MALSPNYGWAEPDNSSLVKNGAQDIRALGDAIDTSVWNVGYGQAGKNKIINSDFGIWQRGTSFATIGTGAFSADRWKQGNNGTGAATVSQQTFTPGTAPVAGYEGTFFLRHAITSVGTTSRMSVQQPIEDVRTFAGQPITVSFWAKADAARTIQFRLDQLFGSGGSTAVSTSTFSFSATTAWQRFSQSLTMPSIAGKTIGTNSAVNLNIFNDTASTSTMDIWGVQVEYGSKATPFQTATGTIQGELAACQRYYYRLTIPLVSNSFAQGSNISTTAYRGAVYFPVEMRQNPTALETSGTANQYAVAPFGASAVTCSAVPSFANSSTRLAIFTATVASGLVDGRAGLLLTDATNGANAYLGWSTEL